jgi:hypothetical protein
MILAGVGLREAACMAIRDQGGLIARNERHIRHLSDISGFAVLLWTGAEDGFQSHTKFSRVSCIYSTGSASSSTLQVHGYSVAHVHKSQERRLLYLLDFIENFVRRATLEPIVCIYGYFWAIRLFIYIYLYYYYQESSSSRT